MSETAARFDKFLEIMDTLLGENGCPWDRAQTHESLRPYLLEECYETAEAIDSGDMPALCEELGDMLMEVIFHAKLAEKTQSFTTADVIDGIAEKLVRRHSHIFGADKAADAGEVEAFWEANKDAEKQYASLAERLRAVPKAMPALMRAQKVIKRAKAEGDISRVIPRVRALLDELENRAEACGSPAKEAYHSIFSEILFHLVKISIILEINAEFSLTNRVEAFINSN